MDINRYFKETIDIATFVLPKVAGNYKPSVADNLPKSGVAAPMALQMMTFTFLSSQPSEPAVRIVKNKGVKSASSNDSAEDDSSTDRRQEDGAGGGSAHGGEERSDSRRLPEYIARGLKYDNKSESRSVISELTMDFSVGDSNNNTVVGKRLSLLRGPGSLGALLNMKNTDKSGYSMLSGDMLTYQESLSMSNGDADSFKEQATADPRILMGWQVMVMFTAY
jgi:hypothetical protein